MNAPTNITRNPTLTKLQNDMTILQQKVADREKNAKVHELLADKDELDLRVRH